MNTDERRIGRNVWREQWRAVRNLMKLAGWRDIVDHWRADSPARMAAENRDRICPPIRAVDAAKLWETCRDTSVRQWRRSRIQRKERREAIQCRIADNLRYDRCTLGVYK